MTATQHNLDAMHSFTDTPCATCINHYRYPMCPDGPKAGALRERCHDKSQWPAYIPIKEEEFPSLAQALRDQLVQQQQVPLEDETLRVPCFLRPQAD